MTWQLGSFAVLAVGLIGGFVWYERTKPDARLVALVGTLAALGALGRIAFAAIPNVKPTTDIVLISGYALGGAPGYVVGAVAALTSNFFFGQGPWTPWQMAGWGATGLLGAGLARVTRRRIGRRWLAAICFAIGFAFTALQDFGDWVTYSGHSLSQLGVYVGQGLGFDLIHAVGCLGFALLFGPALLRALKRFQVRLQVHWSAPAGRAVVPVLLIAIVLSAAAGRPARAAASSTGSPVGYLELAQNRDGGFGAARGEPSSTLFSGWAIMALASAGERPQSVRSTAEGRSAAEYLTATVSQEGSDPGSIERTILAARACGLDPARLAGHDLTAELLRRVGADGSIADQTNLTAFGILALRAAGRTAPRRMFTWLREQQDRDGGFNYSTRGAASDVDDTGGALEALALAPAAIRAADRPAVDRAIAFIRSQQDRDGGFPADQGGASNAQSTAFAVQGLIASDVAPDAMHRHGSPSPVAYLDSLIQPDGAVDYAKGQTQTPVWATAEAEMALAGRPLPILPASRRVDAARSPAVFGTLMHWLGELVGALLVVSRV